MLEEWCSGGKNDFNIRARPVVTANLTCLIIMEEKQLAETPSENIAEGWAPLEFPVSEMGWRESSARTPMCSSGSWKATHAFDTAAEKEQGKFDSMHIPILS